LKREIQGKDSSLVIRNIILSQWQEGAGFLGALWLTQKEETQTTLQLEGRVYPGRANEGSKGLSIRVTGTKA
jgi:hypothetical protein